MDEDWERMTIGVRADAAGFARDVAEMRAALEGPLAAGADRAGRAIETTLARAVRSGKLGFEDLKGVALAAMWEIAASALQVGIGSADRSCAMAPFCAAPRAFRHNGRADRERQRLCVARR